MIEDILYIALYSYFFFTVLFFIVVNATYSVLLLLSYRQIVLHLRHNQFSDYRVMVQSELAVPVSIITPAYNEAVSIVESVRSLLKLSYGKFEVVVVNDGSTDRTMEVLKREFGLRRSKIVYIQSMKTEHVRGIHLSDRPEYRNLIVVDKVNGGKADALNAGINVSRYEHICAIDADSILEDGALLKVMKPFMEDDKVIAVGGIVRIANGCKVVNGRVIDVALSTAILPIFQVVEYFRAFLSGRMAWQGMNALLIISGAFGMFKKSALISAGGYQADTVGEDMELVTRLHRTMREKRERYRIAFVPDPVCWTEAPESLRVLGRQRNRWHRGLLETMLIHRQMILSREYGLVGMAAMPYFFFIELMGPAIEFAGYLIVLAMAVAGILDVEMLLLFFTLSLFYGVMFSVGAVLLEEVSFRRYPRPRDLAMLIAFGMLENFGYRQLTTWWRVKGMLFYLFGKKHWGEMKREGFQSA